MWHLVDTRGFFELVQNGRKVGMKSIVEDWAPKEKYAIGAHSADFVSGFL